jgi:hypothetical protein
LAPDEDGCNSNFLRLVFLPQGFLQLQNNVKRTNLRLNNGAESKLSVSKKNIL